MSYEIAFYNLAFGLIVFTLLKLGGVLWIWLLPQ